MPAPVYAILGDADRDESQEAINLNIVDSSGKHVDLGGGQAEPGDGSITAAKLSQDQSCFSNWSSRLAVGPW